MFRLGYALTCVLLHHLLSFHYQDSCRPSLWPFASDTGYCALLHKALHVLRAAPLLALPVLNPLPALRGP